jgi:hypothetical protein
VGVIVAVWFSKFTAASSLSSFTCFIFLSSSIASVSNSNTFFASSKVILASSSIFFTLSSAAAI